MHLTVLAEPGEAAEHHTENIHQQYAGQIVEIKAEGPNDIFHGSAQGDEAVQEDQRGEHIHWHCKDKCDEPPYLTFQNLGVVEYQTIIDLRITKIVKKCDDECANGNIQRQVGDAFIPVSQAKTIETAA